jgi:hypothetical protein
LACIVLASRGEDQARTQTGDHRGKVEQRQLARHGVDAPGKRDQNPGERAQLRSEPID